MPSDAAQPSTVAAARPVIGDGETGAAVRGLSGDRIARGLEVATAETEFARPAGGRWRPAANAATFVPHLLPHAHAHAAPGDETTAGQGVVK